MYSLCILTRNRPNSAKQSASQTESATNDAQQGVNNNNGGSHDDSDSIFSYYYALDSIAISDESDTEYFDAQGIYKWVGLRCTQCMKYR